MQSSYRTENWFWLFFLVHLIGWTLMPILIRLNLPLDSIEGTIWGHQLEWGYDKNPYLNGWLTALAGHLGGSSGWMVYLFSQLSVVICFWAVWKLGKLFLPSVYALIAVLILEGVQYYNFHAIDFNDNTLELSLWALSIYYFYQALTQKKTRDWLLVGLFTGLGLMAKYYTGVLITCMALFLLTEKEGRQQLRTIKPYLGLLIFLLLTLPHVFWLPAHDYITIKYVFERANSAPSWTNHFFFPAQFAWQQGQAFLPALALFAILLFGKKPMLHHDRFNLKTFDKRFLFYMGMGPFLLTIFLSLLLGIKLRAGWGMPLLSLWGIILIYFLQPQLTLQKFNRFIISIFILFGLFFSLYAFSLTNSPDPSSANFPGKEIAKSITQKWHTTYQTELRYVAGSRWLGGNIGFYSSDHPSVFIEWDQRRAPWINLGEMKKKGGVFIWDITSNETLPEPVKKQFPQLQPAVILEFPWQRNKHHLPSIKIGVAFLPPFDETRKFYAEKKK